MTLSTEHWKKRKMCVCVWVCVCGWVGAVVGGGWGGRGLKRRSSRWSKSALSSCAVRSSVLPFQVSALCHSLSFTLYVRACVCMCVCVRARVRGVRACVYVSACVCARVCARARARARVCVCVCVCYTLFFYYYCCCFLLIFRLIVSLNRFSWKKLFGSIHRFLTYCQSKSERTFCSLRTVTVLKQTYIKNIFK